MISRMVRVKDEAGLHARPAVLLVQAASRFKSVIKLVKDGKEADGKSLLSVLSLAATKGERLELRVSGEDEDEALHALLPFFDQEN